MLFEDRIDVDAYDAYELVHSAYARQVVAAALAPVPEITEGFQLLDIGTGPGLPLQMLLSLLPDLRVTAIDPSKRAFEYLSRRFADDLRVTLHNCCIGEFAGSGTVFDGALSIGASHHLDTGLIFRSARRSLLEGGLFVVYDEFIAPFRTCSLRCVLQIGRTTALPMMAAVAVAAVASYQGHASLGILLGTSAGAVMAWRRR